MFKNLQGYHLIVKPVGDLDGDTYHLQFFVRVDMKSQTPQQDL